MHIGGQNRGHLPALHIRRPAFGVEHEDFDLLAPGHRMDCCRTGVAAGRADNGQLGVRAGQKAFEQLTEQLQRDILERQRWAVEQFEQPMLPVKLYQRRHRIMRKTAIGGGAQIAQFCLG